MRRKRRIFEKEEAAALAWNGKYPIGTAVIQTDDLGGEHERTTESEAWVLDSGVAVIQLTGVRGCYLLSRIRAI